MILANNQLLANTTACGTLISSVLFALAIAWIAVNVLKIIKQSELRVNARQDFDASRRQKIAKVDASYRSFYTLIIELAQWGWVRKFVSFERVGKHLQVGVEPLPWNAQEYVATKTFDLLLQTLIVLMIAVWLRGGVGGFILGAIYFAVMFFSIERSLAQRANVHRRQIDQRLPYAIDLMALMMSAGATIHQTIPVMVRETKGHPINREFKRLQSSIEGGSKFEDALLELRERIGTDAVSELAIVVKQGVAQGTPLADSFLNLAEQMRLRRSQVAEKAAGKAQTMITFPAMLVMVACLIIIVAPFGVSVLYNGM